MCYNIYNYSLLCCIAFCMYGGNEEIYMSEAYLSRGVSAEKTDVHNAVKTLDKGVFKGAFCTLMPDPTGD